MHAENPEEAMTFGELLTLIAGQQRRLSVLENAFSSLSLCLDTHTSQLLIQQLRLQALNQEYDDNIQQHYTELADALEKNIS